MGDGATSMPIVVMMTSTSECVTAVVRYCSIEIHEMSWHCTSSVVHALVGNVMLFATKLSSTHPGMGQLGVRTKSSQCSTQAVATAQHPAGHPATRQLLHHSGHVLFWLIGPAHACKLLQEPCRRQRHGGLSNLLANHGRAVAAAAAAAAAALCREQ